MRYLPNKISKYYNNLYPKVESRKHRRFHKLFIPQKLGKCLKWKVMLMRGTAVLMICHIKIRQMQLTTNYLLGLRRFRFTKMINKITGEISLKVTKLFNLVAPSIAVNVFKKSNNVTSPHKFRPAKYNLKKVETIAKSAPLGKMNFNNQLNPSTSTVTKIWVRIRMRIVKNDIKSQRKECWRSRKSRRTEWIIEKIVVIVIRMRFKL